VSHSDNLETAAAAAGPPLPVDPPLLTPLPGSKSWAAPTNWAEAKEFVPKVKVEKPRSWAQVVNTGVTYPGCELSIAEAESLLCPFYRVGECRYGVGCAYIHGQQCDYCGQAVLHPTHLDQRRGHLAECLQEHERDMELSFAVARSKEKTCGICMETVLDKPKGEARFGILPNCTHCFCLPCIRKWRQAKQFEHKIIRACPECRQTSDYICPSRFWVETTEEKGRLLTDYKKNLGQKECKYFNKGVGECPFGNKCFYQHADKEGRTVDVGPPKKPLRRANADGNLTLVQRLLLYDFLEERDGQLVLPLDFVELLDLYSDDSDEWSDSETN
jgi:E3 ubiquitin-protein ligase makorin